MKKNLKLFCFSIKDFLTLLFLCSLFNINLQAKTDEKTVYGVHEYVLITDDNVKVKSKLDTGALTSSLSATNITYFKKNGKEWVKFTPMINSKDAIEPIEKEVVRFSKIKIRAGEAKTQDIQEQTHYDRPVVKLNICFDDKPYKIEVNLTDRTNFNYPLLIGLNSLKKFKALIDPDLSFQAKKSCEGKK